MPSLTHESLVSLFRNCPAMAPELLRDTLGVSLPEYTEVRIDCADLTDIQPAEYRADLVLLLSHGEPVLGIVLEVQLDKDNDKGYVWPVYVTNLRARNHCPVCLLVVTAEDRVAQWARKRIELGGGNHFTPSVLSLSGIPEITDENLARKEPELAVLSALGHANNPDIETSVRTALMAQMASVGLDVQRSVLYCDLVLNSLPEVARRALSAMDIKKYEYQSEFARRFYGQGRVDLVLKQLTTRYGTLPPEVADKVRNANAVELDGIAERVLTATTLEKALGVSGTAEPLRRLRNMALQS
jgi:hypothetical protein